MKPNYEYIGFNTYVCRTQAGFKQALKHFAKMYELDDGQDSVKSLTLRLRGYPRSYPSKVEFSHIYCGGEYDIVARCIPIRKAIEVLEKLLEKLKSHEQN